VCRIKIATEIPVLSALGVRVLLLFWGALLTVSISQISVDFILHLLFCEKPHQGAMTVNSGVVRMCLELVNKYESTLIVLTGSISAGE
jgi:hypothetical protein